MCGRYALAYDSNELPLAFAQWDINIELNGNNDGDNSVQGDTARGESSDRADLAASEETEHTGEVQADTSAMFHLESFNVAPTTLAPVYTYNKTWKTHYMRWGLIPYWAKDLEKFKGYTTFNARLENLLKGSIWGNCCRFKRCVVPVSGYYEWIKDTKSKVKIPYYLRRKDQKIMFLAGLWDYHEPTRTYTFTIVTGPSPDNLKWLHHRMPCVIEPKSETWNTWMNPQKNNWEQSELDTLLKPWFDEVTYRVYRVSPDVNKAGSQGEYLTYPVIKDERDRIIREDGIIDVDKAVVMEGEETEEKMIGDGKGSELKADNNNLKREENQEQHQEQAHKEGARESQAAATVAARIAARMRQASNNSKGGNPKKRSIIDMMSSSRRSNDSRVKRTKE